MNCPSCLHENPAPAKFCLECGARLTLTCAHCSAALPAGAKSINAADAGGAWFQGALARAVLVDALGRSSASTSEIKAVIAEACELVLKSGGNSLLPRLREAEARLEGRSDRSTLHAGLRAAEEMYRAMGATDPAQRLAEEIER